MSVTVKHALNLRRKKKDGTYPLLLRAIVNRVSLEQNSGYAFLEKDWDQPQQRVRKGCASIENVTRVNNVLQKKRSDVYDKLIELVDRNRLQTLTRTDLKNYLFEKSTDQNFVVDLFQFMRSEIRDLVAAKRIGTAKSYKSLLNILMNYTKSMSLSFREVDYKFLKEFERDHLAKGSKVGSLGVYMRTLRAVYNKAIKRGYAELNDYPFKSYTIKKGEPLRRALPEDSLKRIINTDLKSTALENARAYYLISFFLRGMNWMDICLLQVKNFNKATGRIEYIRHKTGKPFSVKVSGKVFQFMEFIGANLIGRPDEFLFPILESEFSAIEKSARIENKRKKLNKRLKEIANILQIKSFTIYSARHTWATLQKRKGAPTAVIQEGLGHTTEMQTQTYLDSFGNEVVDAYDELLFNDL